MLSLQEIFQKAGKEQVALVQDGPIFYMVFNTKLNMIDANFLERANQILTIVQEYKGPACLVTVNSGSKVFSSGFNLNHMMENPANGPNAIKNMFVFLARLLTINVQTLCVMNGFTVAGGTFMALAHDISIMNQNPKFKFFLNESKNGMHLKDPLSYVVRESTSGGTAKLLTLGQKFGPQEAKQHGIVSELFSDLQDAEKQIKQFAQNHVLEGAQRSALRKTKIDLHGKAYKIFMRANSDDGQELYKKAEEQIGLARL